MRNGKFDAQKNPGLRRGKQGRVKTARGNVAGLFHSLAASMASGNAGADHRADLTVPRVGRACAQAKQKTVVAISEDHLFIWIHFFVCSCRF
jgi:hypothetical protein